jgi:orotate phosphoribosyltransferase
MSTLRSHTALDVRTAEYEADTPQTGTEDWDVLVSELREYALIIGQVTLASGAEAEYYVDAKRALLRGPGYSSVGRLVAAEARLKGASAVGGLTIGADPVACAALGADNDLEAFLVRKQPKSHGMQRWIEGPQFSEGTRCLVVDDVVTTGGSTLQAIERVRDSGLVVAGIVCVLDRLAGGEAKIAEATGGVPYRALTTIDDVYPDRPDR